MNKWKRATEKKRKVRDEKASKIQQELNKNLKSEKKEVKKMQHQMALEREIILHKKLEKSDAQYEKQIGIMKTLCKGGHLSSKELSAAGDRIVEKYKEFLEEAANRTTLKRIENENLMLKDQVNKIKNKKKNIENVLNEKEDEVKRLKKLKNSKTKLAREQRATLTSRQATILNLRNKHDALIDTLDSKSKDPKN